MTKYSRDIDPTAFVHSPAGKQWQNIGIKDHHGLVLPLFSLHSKNSCGIGEYTDLFPLIEWCHSLGLDIIQFLPLNDTGLGTSPYSAISAFALHPIYLGLSSLPYLDQYPELIDEIKMLQQDTSELRIDYIKILQNKKRFLRQYYNEIGAKITQSQPYQDFVEKSNWLIGYAIFKTLKIHHQWKSWENWPEEFQNPTPLLIEQLSEQYHDEVEFHCVVQFLCDQQMRAAKKHAESHQLFLMGDIPILTCRDSADVWLNRDLFNLQFSAGAPPDYLNEDGQNWGFPLYNWERITQTDFKWWIDRLQAAANYYHIYRIDHIVGFFRIWAIPPNKPSKDGLFIPDDKAIWVEHGRQIMWMMLEKCDMLPIGEDLGVVPPEVRSCLSMLGICGTRVVRWERKWEDDKQYIPFSEYPLDSMTTVSTHDSEPLQLWWRNHPEEAKLYESFQGWGYEPSLSQERQFDILKKSHTSNSLFHINLLQEYLTLIPKFRWPNIEDDRINTPGIVSANNWTNRFKPSLEEIIQNQDLRNIMQDLVS
jgi:4-alpha-glucanotransferase